MGYRVEVKIIVDQSDQAIVVPIGALFRRGEGWNAGRAIRVPLRPATISVASSRRPIAAGFPASTANATAASTFGPIDPAANTVAERSPA
jgi:hypothetical protein